jgi:hypothetical protein
MTKSRPVTLRHGAPLELFLDDVVRLRKPHPCGSFDWSVVRLGADIGLRCHGCSRRVLLPRRELERRLKLFVSRGPGFTETPSESPPVDSSDGASDLVEQVPS